jgi:large conductance mechanosensitive channel
VTINYGVFLNALITFLIIALVVFLLIRSVNRLMASQDTPPEKPITKECPYCLSTIPHQARRCPYCTSDL